MLKQIPEVEITFRISIVLLGEHRNIPDSVLNSIGQSIHV